MKLMRIVFALIGFCIQYAAAAQAYQQHQWLNDRLSIRLSNGTLNIIPQSAKAVRVKWQQDGIDQAPELIFVRDVGKPLFKHSETAAKLTLSTSAITVTFDKETAAISYRDSNGKSFLNEVPGSRRMLPDSIQGERCFITEQSFDSPGDEYLFGLGQFQDGHYNLRNVSRQLIQVNSQIAIPFIFSSRGYGLLWHQYGITDFNPADHSVSLVRKDSASSNKNEVEVTTTSGTQRVTRQQSLYAGKVTIESEADYSFMLDLGNMESRHLLIIDDSAYIDQTNLWLPPAASQLIHLKAGDHSVQVVCKSTNTPRLAWRLAGNETTFRSVNAKSLDYTVFYGNNADEVIADYRHLSGSAPMLPLWAYGFWQCRERYTSGKHLVETIKEFRKRNLPVDVIVQDWQYWGKLGWGVPQFDTTYYPNPEKFIKELHDLHAHFSISVWENLDKKSEVAKDYVAKNLYIPNSPWIDIYNPETGKAHWNALNKNLFSKGVDSWWMDATEPENDALAGRQTYLGPGEFYRLTYPLFVSKAIYEGQRNADPGKRVTILTRSAFAGQQRYGTINWSGDIGGNWDSFKRQIVAGLNYSLTGMPYWTTDIGGFFRPGRSQYSDSAYHDLLTRWFQWGAFTSIFRIHGYQSETEPWKYGVTVENDMREMLNLRYRLLPYIYSQGWQVSKKGSTIMRPLVMDFGNDKEAVAQAFQYMFGKAILVAPVIQPNVSQWNLYLPRAEGWFDFWTNQYFTGGQHVNVPCPQNKIPLFVKAGSMIPMGPVMQYSSERRVDTLDLYVYEGANGKFELYEDEGDGYNYEKGMFTVIPFSWDQQARTLTIGELQGSYPGYLKKRVFNLIFVTSNTNADKSISREVLVYDGRKLSVTR
jgi:alpha-D-xyloside xylohydrolase